MSSIPQTYYVYVLARPNGRAFYVGKGKGRRIYDHEKEARSDHKCHKCNVIRKIWKQGGEVQRYTVFTTENEQEALDYECELIALYGRKTLANLTDGGDGASGYHHPEVARRKISANKKQLYENAEARKQAGNGSRLAWQNAEARERRIEDIRKRTTTPENRVQVGQESKKRWSDPDYRAKITAKVKAAMTPDICEQRSRKAKQRYTDPAAREKTSQALKAAKSTPEARARQSEISRKQWQNNPERRIAFAQRFARLTHAQGEEIRRLFATGEYTRKRLAAMFHVCLPVIRQIIRGTQTAWKPDDLP